MSINSDMARRPSYIPQNSEYRKSFLAKKKVAIYSNKISEKTSNHTLGTHNYEDAIMVPLWQYYRTLLQHNAMVQHRCYQNPSLDTIISQCHQPLIFTIDFPKFHVNIALLSLPRSTKRPLSLKSRRLKLYVFTSPQQSYALSPSQDCYFHSPDNNIQYLYNKHPVYRTTYIYGLLLQN